MKGVDGYEVGSHQRNFSQCFISMLTAGFASSTLCPTSSCRALLNVALRAGLRSAERKISSRWPLALCPFQDSMQQGSGIDQLQRPVYLSHKLRILSTCPQGNSDSQSVGSATEIFYRKCALPSFQCICWFIRQACDRSLRWSTLPRA